MKILDASALLAMIQNEPGGERVREAIVEDAFIGVVNFAEVLSKLAERGRDPAAVVGAFRRHGILGDGLRLVESFDEWTATEVARLRPLTKNHGLSIGDRACLALARDLSGSTVLHAETRWAELPDLGVRLEHIRAKKKP